MFDNLFIYLPRLLFRNLFICEIYAALLAVHNDIVIYQGKKPSKSLSVFDDEDLLFGAPDADPSVDLFGSSSPLATSKKVNESLSVICRDKYMVY